MDTYIIILLISLLIVIILLILGTFITKKEAADWKKKVKNRLNLILKDLASSENFHTQKSILIEIDTLLGETFRYKGIKGKTIGERLKNAKVFYEKRFYNEIWEAHKLRNKLVHELDYNPKVKEIGIAIDTLKLAIRKLL